MHSRSPTDPKDFARAFDDAVALHKAGDYRRAAESYEALRPIAPNNAQLLYLLGAAYTEQERTSDAIAVLERSLELRPDFLPAIEMAGTAWIRANAPEKSIPYFMEAASRSPTSAAAAARVAGALQRCGRHADAKAAFERTLALQPTHKHALLGLATCLMHVGEPEEAERVLRQCMQLYPDYRKAQRVLGSLLGQNERFIEAEEILRAALAAAPADTEARKLLAATVHKQGRRAEAEAMYRDILLLDPGDQQIRVQLGEALLDQSRHDAAEVEFREALRSAPATAAAITGLGRVQELRGDLEEAITLHDQALACEPTCVNAYVNRGSAKRYGGNFEGALEDYDAALRLRPRFPPAVANRGLALLTLGRLGEAWPEYRSRIRARDGAVNLSGIAPWDGSPLTGKRVLVWMEYGLGDEVLFASLLPELLAKVAHCTVVCAPRLCSIFKRSFPAAEILPMGEPITGVFDVQMPLTDTAAWLRPSLASIPPHDGYLKHDRALEEKLRARYRGSCKRIVGLSWRSASGATGRFKSIALEHWRDILATPDISFVSLQYGDCDAELNLTTPAGNKPIIVDRTIDARGDMDAFAAQVAAMDLVISVSNTTVHFAGALGRPVWVMVPKGIGAHWYWFLSGQTNPWYPSAKLFRQSLPGDWRTPLAAAAAELPVWAER